MSNLAIQVILVRLKSDEYSVPKGSIGYISEVFPTDTRIMSEAHSFTVGWMSQPGPGGSSTPVIPEDLESLGYLYVRVGEDAINEILFEYKDAVPDAVIERRAKGMLHEMLNKFENGED